MDLPEVGRAMGAVPGVRDVHDLHIWSLCPGAVALSAHVTVEGTRWEQAAEIQAHLKEVLRGRFDIEHTTIQLECTQCPQGVVSCVDDRPGR